MSDPFYTQEQFNMRTLIEQLANEEMPLTIEQLRQLGPFVKKVREEIVETASKPAVVMTMLSGDVVEVTPRQLGGIRRVGYFMLNDLGLRMKFDWDRGLLDKHIDTAGPS